MSDLYDALTSVRDLLADMMTRLEALEAASEIDVTGELEEKIQTIAKAAAEEAIEEIDWCSKVYDEVSNMSFSVRLD